MAFNFSEKVSNKNPNCALIVDALNLAFRWKHQGRTDFRYDSNHNKLFMLELNTQPGMTETSLAPEQALFCQITMKQMVKILIEEATYEC